MSYEFYNLGDYNPVNAVLPEEEDHIARVLVIAMDAFTAPKDVKADHIHYSMENLENIQAYLTDPGASDLVGEIVELLGKVSNADSVSFETCRRGKDMVRELSFFLGLSFKHNSNLLN